MNRDEWVRLNTCKFCIGSHLHSCSGYDCRTAAKEATEYFDRTEGKKLKRVTDLRPMFTESLMASGIVTGAWIMSDDKKKEIVVKFNGIMSKMERMTYLYLIGESLLNMAADEDEKGGGKSGFGDLMDGMQLREWHKEDEETIKNGIPHEMERRQQDNE